MSNEAPDPASANVLKSAALCQKKGFAFAHLAFILSVIMALFLLGTMMATRLSFISLDLGFKTLTLEIGPRLAIVSLIIAAISSVMSLFLDAKRCAPWALAAVLISGGILIGYTLYNRTQMDYPPIADVASNWDRPLSFSEKLMRLRGADAVKVEDLPRVAAAEAPLWNGKTLPVVNRATCPEATTLLNTSVNESGIVDLVARLKKKNYVVFGTSPWRIEVIHQDNFYGFKSDIVIRIDPTSVDVRSVSRYAHPDLGENCRLVVEVLDEIKALQTTSS